MDIDEELDDLEFNVARSIRYHDKRKSFFELAKKTADVLTLVASSAAVVALLDQIQAREIALLMAAGAALVSALSIVFEFSSKYALYSSLLARFAELQGKIVSCSAATEAHVVCFKQERQAIERDEPPISKPLNVICFNEAVDALGRGEEHKKPIGLWGRLKAYTYLS